MRIGAALLVACAEPTPAPTDATVLIGARDDLGAWQMLDGSPVRYRNVWIRPLSDYDGGRR